MTALNTKLWGSADRARAAVERQQRWLNVLMHVSRAIGTIRDRQDLMTAIVERVTDAFDADRSTLYLHDRAHGELWTQVAQGLEGSSRELRIPEDRGLCGKVFKTHEALCIDDTFEVSSFDRGLAAQTGYVPRSMLVVPVMQGSARCVGVIQVMDERVGHFDAEDIALLEAISVQVAITLENAELYLALKRQFRSFVAAFSAALDARDPLTAIHSVNVANYAMGIGQVLGLPSRELEWLRIAGLLHDVGKIGVPEAVLTKAGRLTTEEFEEMKRHAEYSRIILSKIEFAEDLQGLGDVAAAHHEKLDGSGYPEGLRDQQIPLKARILAVADVFDALTQTRHYRQGMTMHEALRVIDEMTPQQLDRHGVGALKAFLGCGPWPIA